MLFPRRLSFLAIFAVIFSLTPIGPHALAQEPSASSSSQPAPKAPSLPAKAIESFNGPPRYSRDLALSGFFQVSGSTAANYIREDTTSSVGGMLSFRLIHRPWLGMEANYGFTRYTDTYFYGALRIPHNTHEVSLAYLLETPQFYGFRGFLTLGGGAVIFSPVSPASETYGVDAKALYVYGVGLQHAVVSDRWGVRLQYRGLDYGVPAFGQINLDTHRGRHTSEPALGVYYRF